MRSRSPRRFAHVTTAAALLTAAVLTGCADPESSSDAADRQSDASIDELAAHDGRVCPNRLPQRKAPFGTDEPAESAPSLAAPESAWVCQYELTEAGAGSGGDGTTSAWVLAGEVRPVDSTRLPAIERDLTGLAPADAGRSCTDDLGPRWMLVYSHGRDLTGVVVDDFGCGDVRLTDDPFESAPGDAAQEGIVPGVLADPAGLLNGLRTIRRCREAR